MAVRVVRRRGAAGGLRITCCRESRGRRRVKLLHRRPHQQLRTSGSSDCNNFEGGEDRASRGYLAGGGNDTCSLRRPLAFGETPTTAAAPLYLLERSGGAAVFAARNGARTLPHMGLGVQTAGFLGCAAQRESTWSSSSSRSCGGMNTHQRGRHVAFGTVTCQRLDISLAHT